jgi:hypothetical protein
MNSFCENLNTVAAPQLRIIYAYFTQGSQTRLGLNSDRCSAAGCPALVTVLTLLGKAVPAAAPSFPYFSFDNYLDVMYLDIKIYPKLLSDEESVPNDGFFERRKRRACLAGSVEDRPGS